VDRTDALWTGLKLLGAYFIVVGLAQSGTAIYHLSRIGWYEPIGSLEWLRMNQLGNLIAALIELFGGWVLWRATKRFVPESRIANHNSLLPDEPKG
jgi:hypothetical protein